MPLSQEITSSKISLNLSKVKWLKARAIKAWNTNPNLLLFLIVLPPFWKIYIDTTTTHLKETKNNYQHIVGIQ